MLAAIDPWILGFSAVTVLLTLAMGFWAAGRSRTASDFFVAGRGVSVGWNASAISGEYLSAASFMGIAGMVMSSGYDALWYPVCYACGYLFLLLFIAGPLRRFGAYTIPDFAEGRYDSPVFRKIAVVFVLFIGFFYTMPQMKGAGTALAYIFPGLPYWAGVVLIGAVITVNVALGGMKGITLVQAFQYWVKMFAISVPVFVLMAVHGGYGHHLGLNQRPAPVTTTAPQDLSPAAGWQQVEPAPSEFTNADSTFASSSPMMCWLTENEGRPGLLEQAADATRTRYAVARELKDAQVLFGQPTALKAKPWVRLVESNLAAKPLVYSGPNGEILNTRVLLVRDEPGVVKVLPENRLEAYRAAGLVAPAGTQVGRSPLPEKAPDDATWLQPFGPLTGKAAARAGLSDEAGRGYGLLYTYSLILALVCGTAGLPHILVRFYTNPDGVAAKRTTMWVMILIGVFYVFPPIFGVIGRNLLPELYLGTGSKGTDKVVLELPRIIAEKYGILGSVLSGITCAGAFAAFMSTFSGLLVSMTGALAHDVYGRMLRPESTPAQRMAMFKWCAVLIGAVATLLGCFVEPLQINFMVGQAFAIAAASYFPLLFMSVWWRGMTMRGAATGMLAGGIAAVVAVTLTNFSDLGWLPLDGFWASNPLLRILCEQPAIWTVPLAIGLMVVVSKADAARVPADIRMKMLVLHAPEALGLKQEYIRDHEGPGGH